MNRAKLERYLASHGCFFHRHGKRHDHWLSPGSGRPVPVPRHIEVDANTARGICRDLGVPPPPEK